MKKIAFFLSILLFMGTVFVHAQTRSISGTVTSAEDNQPVPGVSVSVKGTTVGSVTNVDGDFQLNIPQDAKTLIFSFIGMKNQEIEIGSQTSFNMLYIGVSILSAVLRQNIINTFQHLLTFQNFYNYHEPAIVQIVKYLNLLRIYYLRPCFYFIFFGN